MRSITELPAWERLLKKMAWAQLGSFSGKKILDFGSGCGITANHYAKENSVVAIEPSAEMLKDAWKDHCYTQLIGDISALSTVADDSFDVVICHNVLEYVENKAQVVAELCRVLKPGGTLSVIKHNRAGRVMQMAVLLDDLDKAYSLLDGNDGMASQFGVIRYYVDEDVVRWAPELTLTKCLGIRTFWDLQQNQAKHGDEEWQSRMMALEMRVSDMEEYRRIAFFHHLLFTKG